MPWQAAIRSYNHINETNDTALEILRIKQQQSCLAATWPHSKFKSFSTASAQAIKPSMFRSSTMQCMVTLPSLLALLRPMLQPFQDPKHTWHPDLLSHSELKLKLYQTFILKKKQHQKTKKKHGGLSSFTFSLKIFEPWQPDLFVGLHAPPDWHLHSIGWGPGHPCWLECVPCRRRVETERNLKLKALSYYIIWSSNINIVIWTI